MNNPGSLVPVAIGGLAFIKEYIPLPDEEASDPDADVERDATAGTEAAERNDQRRLVRVRSLPKVEPERLAALQRERVIERAGALRP